MQFFHDDVVLEIGVPPEVKTDPVAKFIILERLDLKETQVKSLKKPSMYNQSQSLYTPTPPTSRSVM